MTPANRPAKITPVAHYALSKVPEATALFWVLKVLSTGMGEVVSDAVVEVNRYASVTIAGVLLVAALVWQIRGTRYRAIPYWTAVAMVSTFGTMVADFPHQVLGIPFWVTTIAFASLVVGLLGAWYLSERTLSIHSITTRRREFFYWSVVMATFALGTALGDLLVEPFKGYFLIPGILFAVLITLPGLAYQFLKLNGVAAFWMSYVVTRPLGASFADYLWVPLPWGAGFGKMPVAIVSVIVFLIILAIVVKTRNGDPAVTMSTSAATSRSGTSPAASTSHGPDAAPEPEVVARE